MFWEINWAPLCAGICSKVLIEEVADGRQKTHSTFPSRSGTYGYALKHFCKHPLFSSHQQGQPWTVCYSTSNKSLADKGDSKFYVWFKLAYLKEWSFWGFLFVQLIRVMSLMLWDAKKLRRQFELFCHIYASLYGLYICFLPCHGLDFLFLFPFSFVPI